MTIPTLLQKPINQMSRFLIYNPVSTNRYNMLDLFNSKYAGFMIARPIQGNGEDALFVDLLVVQQQRVGIGTKFIEFAKNLSKKLGCEGRILLEADKTVYDPHNPPHIFYRKNGFTCDDKKMLKKIDKCIKRNKQLNYLKTPSLVMYYPEKAKLDVGMWCKIKGLFRK